MVLWHNPQVDLNIWMATTVYSSEILHFNNLELILNTILREDLLKSVFMALIIISSRTENTYLRSGNYKK